MLMFHASQTGKHPWISRPCAACPHVLLCTGSRLHDIHSMSLLALTLTLHLAESALVASQPKPTPPPAPPTVAAPTDRVPSFALSDSMRSTADTIPRSSAAVASSPYTVPSSAPASQSTPQVIGYAAVPTASLGMSGAQGAGGMAQMPAILMPGMQGPGGMMQGMMAFHPQTGMMIQLPSMPGAAGGFFMQPQMGGFGGPQAGMMPAFLAPPAAPAINTSIDSTAVIGAQELLGASVLI